MTFHQSGEKCSILTPDIRKQSPSLIRINFKDKLRFNNSWQLEGAMYITLWKLLGAASQKISFMQFSQNIDGFRQNDSQGF